MPTTGEQEAGLRLALVVATTSYADATLAELRAPGQDASDLAAVLEDASIGGFALQTVLDAPADALRRSIAGFCARGGPRDLALVYLSCHGVLDDRGRLYYAATDTDHNLLAATAISAAWLNEQLEDCRCRRQILVLDCCHSGAFAKGAKGEGGLALGERFEGRGRVVLTASRATEYSFEGDRVVGAGVSSVFTGALVEGLRSGDADRDRDGVVTVAELYDYTYDAVRAAGARQTPTLWTYGAEGGLLVARSPRGTTTEPAPLPDDLIGLLESARPRVREGAVGELAELMAGPDPGRALAARQQLERIAAQDIAQVAAAARRALEPEAGPAPAPAAREPAPADSAPPPLRPPSTTQRGRPSRRRALAIAAAAIAAAVAVVVAVVVLSGGSPRTEAGPSRIPLSGEPQGIAVDKGVVWVARHKANKVTRIDRASNTQSGDVDVAAPDKVAAGEGSVWVTASNGKRLQRIDPKTRKVTATQNVDVQQTVCTDCPSPGLKIADGALWLGAPGHGAGITNGTITRRDLLTGDVKRTIHPGPGFEGQFAVGKDARGEEAVWAVGQLDEPEQHAWLKRIDPDSDQVVAQADDLPGSFINGAAYGERRVWLPDAADAKHQVIRFDADLSERMAIGGVDSITGDDIAVATGAVLVWDPAGAVLTRIDVNTSQVTETQVPGYVSEDQLTTDEGMLNKRWSDLAVANGFAWLTDPAHDAVQKVRFVG